MKKIIKYISLVCFIFIYTFIPEINIFLSKEINYLYISCVVAESFYDDSVSVGTEEKILVSDYLVENNRLFVFPLDGKVILPIGVMITKINNKSIEVVAKDLKYKIFNLDSLKVKLYQYIPYNNSVGNTSSFYIIEGDNIDLLINNYEIYYEKV